MVTAPLDADGITFSVCCLKGNKISVTLRHLAPSRVSENRIPGH